MVSTDFCLVIKVGEKMEVQPGMEFRVGYEEAVKCGAEVALGDRPIQVFWNHHWCLYFMLFQRCSHMFFSFMLFRAPLRLQRITCTLSHFDQLCLLRFSVAVSSGWWHIFSKHLQITLRRAWGMMSMWSKAKLIYSILSGCIFMPSAEELAEMVIIFASFCRLVQMRCLTMVIFLSSRHEFFLGVPDFILSLFFLDSNHDCWSFFESPHSWAKSVWCFLSTLNFPSSGNFLGLSGYLITFWK